MTATDTPVRGLPAICEAARLAECGLCWARAGLACEMDPGHGRGYHVSRFGRAYRQGRISNAEYWAVLCSVPVYTSRTVIYPDMGGQP